MVFPSYSFGIDSELSSDERCAIVIVDTGDVKTAVKNKTSCELIARQLDHPPFGTLEQLDWSLIGKSQVVAADRLWEHIPIVGLMVVENKRCVVNADMVKHDVEIETVDECVDEIDKLAELTDEMQLSNRDGMKVDNICSVLFFDQFNTSNSNLLHSSGRVFKNLVFT
ncbi:hypothetical protein Tco_0531760 [Tanacetum coccineum]